MYVCTVPVHNTSDSSHYLIQYYLESNYGDTILELITLSVGDLDSQYIWPKIVYEENYGKILTNHPIILLREDFIKSYYHITNSCFFYK